MCFMQIESVLQTKNRSELAKNPFSVALNRVFVFAKLLGETTLNLFCKLDFAHRKETDFNFFKHK